MPPHTPLKTEILKLREELARTEKKLEEERIQRRRLEAGLRFTDLVSTALLDTISDALLLIRPDARILRINQAMRRWYNIPEENEAEGQILWDLLSKEQRSKREKHLTSVLATGSPLHYEDQSGSMHMALSIWPVFDAEKKITALFVLGRDITSQKEAEAKARNQQEQLIQAAKMVALGTLVSGVAHEINNPTNFIMLNLPLIEDSWESARPILQAYHESRGDFDLGGLPYSEMKDYLPELFEGIRDGGRRIRNIVEDLKNFARQDSPDLSRKVHINEVVRTGISLLGTLIRKNAPRFRVRYGEDMPFIRGNPQKLEQVIINLIQNACQSLTDRDQAIRVHTLYDSSTREIRVEIKDEGRGIPEHILPHIQDPFYTTRRDQGGTGLGLSISASIVREHGGRLEISSEEGKGSVFTLCLPLQPPAMRKKILVVDDEKGIRTLLADMLRENALFDVHEADSGMAACLKLGSLKPDLLVLDLNMPDMNGVEVCEWVRTEPDLKDLKIIIVTGYGAASAIAELEKLDVPDVLAKPVSMQDLEKAAIRLLRLSGGDQP
ncbi:PAS domain S-box-containing protein [Desulfobotulus alkaliphilus]|uniref:histidine kinase n=1 Tax=Desulfobotulus alkaliphilus TaxID=622671 RepID=A0A562R8W3_9BACT|nr:ATP-binding protein [Desulfobotulus alkaliphilus]TWI64846.1 PAS domain S-box-containing protein [Desulfobotulus alkaliphilus]